MLEGTPWGAHRRVPLVGPRSRARRADPRTLVSIRYKRQIRPGGLKFDTDSRGLSPKATGLHLVGVRGDTLTSTLALPASLSEVGGSNGRPQNFGFYSIKKTKYGPGVPSLTLILGLKSQGNGVTPSWRQTGHLVLHVAQYCSTALLLYCATALLPTSQNFSTALLRYCSTVLLLYCQLHILAVSRIILPAVL